jgi:hypothetical protein
VNRLDVEAKDELIIIKLVEQAKTIPTDAASKTPVIYVHPQKWRKKKKNQLSMSFSCIPN